MRKFDFADACLKAFEVMCDNIGVPLSVVLGQRLENILHPIYYARKALNVTQKNYTVTDQDLLYIVFALEKFGSYLLGTAIKVHIKHLVLGYLMAKMDTQL